MFPAIDNIGAFSCCKMYYIEYIHYIETHGARHRIEKASKI